MEQGRRYDSQAHPVHHPGGEGHASSLPGRFALGAMRQVGNPKPNLGLHPHNYGRPRPATVTEERRTVHRCDLDRSEIQAGRPSLSYREVGRLSTERWKATAREAQTAATQPARPAAATATRVDRRCRYNEDTFSYTKL